MIVLYLLLNYPIDRCRIKQIIPNLKDEIFYFSPVNNDSCKDENYTSTTNRTDSAIGDSSSEV